MHNNEIIHDASSQTEILTLELVHSFVSEIETLLKKALIGVDFIIDAEDPKRVYCIDINLFPSYTGFSGVSKYMGELIRRRCGVYDN